MRTFFLKIFRLTVLWNRKKDTEESMWLLCIHPILKFEEVFLLATSILFRFPIRILFGQKYFLRLEISDVKEYENKLQFRSGIQKRRWDRERELPMFSLQESTSNSLGIPSRRKDFFVKLVFNGIRSYIFYLYQGDEGEFEHPLENSFFWREFFSRFQGNQRYMFLKRPGMSLDWIEILPQIL